jgi:hypothetical protein
MSLFFTMPRTVGTHLPHWGTQPRWRNTPAGDEIPVSIATKTCFSVKALQMQTYTVPSPGRFFFTEPFVRNGRVGRWPFVPNAFVSSRKPAASWVRLLLQLGHGRRVWLARVRASVTQPAQLGRHRHLRIRSTNSRMHPPHSAGLPSAVDLARRDEGVGFRRPHPRDRLADVAVRHTRARTEDHRSRLAAQTAADHA